MTGQLTFGEENGRGQCLVFESMLEHDFALCAIYAPGVMDVEDQVGPVRWIDATGKTRKHTFDFRVQRVTRKRIGVVVKPSYRAMTAKFQDEVGRVALAAVPGFVDQVCIVTEANICPCALARAKQYHAARFPDEALDNSLAAALDALVGEVTIASLLHAADIGVEGFGGILRLLRFDKLRAREEGLVRMSTSVYRPAGH